MYATRNALLPALSVLLLAVSTRAADPRLSGLPEAATWLRLEALPPAVILHRCSDAPSGSLALAATSVTARAVRVDGVRLAYLSAGKVVRTERVEDFFDGDWLKREARIDPGKRVEWIGLCLRQPPASADTVRIELDMSSGLGLRRKRGTQSLAVPFEPEPAPRDFAPPFEGHWRVTQGHHCRTNHRIGGHGGAFAWDFAAIDRRGRLATEAYEIMRRNQDTAAFGASVHAPADGRVVRIVDAVPDNEGLVDYPRRSIPEDLAQPHWRFGNFIVMDVGQGVYLLLAHLQRGSVDVEAGDQVRTGERIARCGNSGNSISPHLHLQVMDRADPMDPLVRGLPARLSGYVGITVVEEGNRREVSRSEVDRGDPPEGSLLFVGPR